MRLGKERNFKMKFFNWIWSKKQEEVETFVIKNHQMVDENSRAKKNTGKNPCHIKNLMILYYDI